MSLSSHPRSSNVNVVFSLSISQIVFVPSSPISLSSTHSWLFIHYLPLLSFLILLRYRNDSVVFCFSASLITFAPSSPILLPTISQSFRHSFQFSNYFWLTTQIQQCQWGVYFQHFTQSLCHFFTNCISRYIGVFCLSFIDCLFNSISKNLMNYSDNCLSQVMSIWCLPWVLHLVIWCLDLQSHFLSKHPLFHNSVVSFRFDFFFHTAESQRLECCVCLEKFAKDRRFIDQRGFCVNSITIAPICLHSTPSFTLNIKMCYCCVYPQQSHQRHPHYISSFTFCPSGCCFVR